MRQRPAVEAKRNSLALDVLLTTARHNLRNVEVTTFGAGTDHVFESVGGSEGVEYDLPGFITGDVQLVVHHHFKRFHSALTRLLFQLA